MMYLGQLLDVLDDNERLTIRSSVERTITYIDELKLADAKAELTKAARQCSIAQIYSDMSDYRRETVMVVYIRPNGCSVIGEDIYSRRG